jgi:glycosyltransferase involved in cell wall biosynthesis
MIVKDEEHGLRRAIESAAPWVDEIIVVDTGSTDATVDIARNAGARVAHFQFAGGLDLGAARTHSIQLARSDWALLLDGDTVLEEESGQYLRPAAVQCTDSPKTILGLWKNPGQASGADLEAYCRTMVPIGDGGRFLGRRHEYFIGADGNILPTVRAPQISLKHWGVDPDYVQTTGRLNKMKVNAELTLRQLSETPEYSVFWIDAIRGNRYSLQRCELALDLVTKYKASLERGEIRFVGEEAPFLVAYYEALAAIQLDRFEQAAVAAASALASSPSRDMLAVLAATKAEGGRDDESCADMLKAESMGPEPHVYTGLAQGCHITSKMLTVVAGAAERCGRRQLALDMYRRAMATFPTYEHGPTAFARFLREIGLHDAAFSLLGEALDAFPENRDYARLLLEGWDGASVAESLDYVKAASDRWPQNTVFSEILAPI